jgi:hypothetical protein
VIGCGLFIVGTAKAEYIAFSRVMGYADPLLLNKRDLKNARDDNSLAVRY